jgi:hypothetical protein
MDGLGDHPSAAYTAKHGQNCSTSRNHCQQSRKDLCVPGAKCPSTTEEYLIHTGNAVSGGLWHRQGFWGGGYPLLTFNIPE